jgi:pantoate--beta-alanine ligase
MKIITSVQEMIAVSCSLKQQKKTIGLVPTMGALHSGHLSLVEHAKKNCAITVMSIFVNPTQFGPKEDFNKYPRPFEADCKKAEVAGCDIVFSPDKLQMYPTGFCSSVLVNGLSDLLCGSVRPGHFAGVATVVLKFFNIVNPDIAVFGQKDAQQCIIIRRMVTDLNQPVKLVFIPTLREADGLAMSSRNAYLTPQERGCASRIFKALNLANQCFLQGEKKTAVLQSVIEVELKKTILFSIEYIEIVDTVLLQPREVIGDTMIVAIAVRTKESNTRLIDNIILGGSL